MTASTRTKTAGQDAKDAGTAGVLTGPWWKSAGKGAKFLIEARSCSTKSEAERGTDEGFEGGKNSPGRRKGAP